MNRFVLKYTVGDGCTYSCDIVVPIEAESIEEIYVKLSEKALAVAKEYEEHEQERYRLLRINRETGDESAYEKVKALRDNMDFELFGRKFDAHDLTFKPTTRTPKKKGRTETVYGERQFDSSIVILTLDQWFADPDQ